MGEPGFWDNQETAKGIVSEMKVLKAVTEPVAEESGAVVDPHRFRGPDDPYPRHWTPVGTPVPWTVGPEEATP